MKRLYITEGEKVLYKNKECIIIRIIDVCTISIEEKDTNIIHTIPVNLVEPYDPNHISKIKEIHSLSEKEWEKALYRYNIIQPILNKRGDLALIQEVSNETKISIPTLYRWIKLFDETELVSSLAGKKHTGGIGKSRLTEKLNHIIENKIHSVYLTKSRKSITKTILEIELECNRLGIKPPHSNTIRNRIKNISEEERIKKRLGIKEAKYKFEPLKNHFEAEYPLSVVQIDHTLVDIILVDEQFRKPYKRPWLTLAIDIYSRMVVGFYLSYETPGALGTGMCISNTILPKEIWLEKLGISTEWNCWGVMDTIHVDNAKEFRGNMLKRACQDYGIKLQFRPIGTPHWGGHIERLLGTFSKEIHNLPGTTFSSEAERKKYQSEKNAAFTLNEFEKWLTLYITKVYHKRIHSSLDKTPEEKWEEEILGLGSQIGRGIPARIYNERKVRLDFMPYVERTIQEYGVVIDHIHYYDDILRNYVHDYDNNKKENKLHVFKRDPRDISIVYFFEPKQNEYFNIPYRNTSFPPISIWEYRDLLKKLKSNKINITEDNIFNAYRELNDLEEKVVRETKRKQKLDYVDIFRSEPLKTAHKTIESEIINTETILPFEDLEDETFTT